MYFTCGSMASWSSSGREEEPARPGPETSDILEGVLSFSSGIGSVEENVGSEIGEMPWVEMGRSQISRANQRCRQPDLTALVARGLFGGGGLCDMIGWGYYCSFQSS
jgi:hypothetical protein